jgi:hypothetical protein
MRRLWVVAMVLACGACQPMPDATVTGTSAAAESPGTQPAAAAPPCSNYTVPVTVGGQQQQAVVEACQQSDGSWRITQNTPGLPPQVYEVPAPTDVPYPYPVGYAYPDFFPYWGDWVGSPWYWGLGPSIFVVQRFNHFHHGFNRGFPRGFAGFGHRFAAARAGGMGGGHR